MNTALLKSYMVKNGDTQTILADAMGISLSNLNAKINNNETSFRQSEILFLKERYNLSSEEVDLIFFGKELS